MLFLTFNLFAGGPDNKPESKKKTTAISAVEKGDRPTFAEMAAKEKKGQRWACRINLAR